MQRLLIAGLLTSFMTASSARADVTTDHQLWLDASIRTEVIDDLKAHFTQNLRERSKREGGRQFIPELGLNYGFLKYFSIGAGGRYGFEKDKDGDTANTARLQGELEAETPTIGPLEIGYRLRAQRETATNEDKSKVRLRNKATLQLKTEAPVTPEVFYEHFLDPSGESGHKAQKYRLGGGLAAKIDRHHRLKFRFFQDKEIDGDGDKTRVASIGYRYSF